MVGSNEISGKKVVSIKGDDIGEVKDVDFDIEKWQVTHIRLKLSNKAAVALGYKKTIGSYEVCMPVSLVTSIGDVVTINKTLVEIAQDLDIKECPPKTFHRSMTIGL
jgi:sporulation protein YlmC with PRC-barrel domain